MRRSSPLGTDLATLWQALGTGRLPSGLKAEHALGRVLRAAAAELRRKGLDPLPILLATPAEPACASDAAPGGVEGAAPTRRRFKLTVTQEIAHLERAIATREANGHNTDWHHARRKELLQRELKTVERALAGEG